MSRRSDAPNIPIFGEKREGQAYIPRPGVYAIVFDDEKRIAVIQTQWGFYLPGGGIERNELVEESLRREVREELGYEAHIQRKIGEAIEYIFAAKDNQYFCIHGTFFEVVFTPTGDGAAEQYHTLFWLTPSEAIEKLSRRSQAWAVQQGCRKNQIPSSLL